MTILFEQKYHGGCWRLEVISFKGRNFANWRQWYEVNGEWRPTKSGCTFPLERLLDLTSSLIEFHGKGNTFGT